MMTRWRRTLSKPSTPLVSVIIPTLNEATRIGQALTSIGELGADLECLVIDGGSDDQTCETIQQWPDVKLIVANAAGRGKQMNIGARSAKGDILLFLHGDCRLPADAIDNMRKAFAQRQVVGGSFCLAFTRRHWVLQLSSLCSRINHPLTTYGDQAQFMRRDAFLAIGGFREWPLMEDLEIQYRLRRRGRLIKIRRPVLTSDRRYRRHGPFLHQMFNIFLVTLYLAGASPERLAKWYRPRSPAG